MDERSLWRMAWYWKKSCVYLFLPIGILLAVLLTLTNTGHLSRATALWIDRPIVFLDSGAFAIWMTYKARKHDDTQQRVRNT
jgi:putative copper export protein